MAIREELERYAKNCIGDKIISNVEHKWACWRFLNDLKRVGNEDFPFVWNDAKAEQIVKWFSLLYHSQGVLAGQPIRLEPCQKFIACQIYGWVEADTGFRRFKNSFVELARKNAKSQLEAGIALFEISCTAVKNQELTEAYCAGIKRDQSKIIFDECKNMLQKSPLRPKFRITREAITHRKSGSFLKPLSKQDGKNGDGTHPALLVLDEYHLHPDKSFYDQFLGASGKEPLMMIITTAGRDLNCPCYQEEYEYALNVLNPDVNQYNDRYFFDIFKADDGDDPFSDEAMFKANPIRAYYPKGLEMLKDSRKRAKDIPEELTAYMTKCLDLWVQRRNDGYMDMEKFNACLVDKCPVDLSGKSVYVGLDLSTKIDLSSVSFIIPYQEDETTKFILFSHSFIPSREKLHERIVVDKQPYDAWERGGYITVTESEIIDQEVIMRYVFSFIKKHGLVLETLCFDPANASRTMMDLSNQGYDVTEVYQSHKSLNEATQGFREQVYAKNFMILKNPVLEYAMANAVTKTNQGLIKIDKDATNRRIDPVDATLCAYKLAHYHEFHDPTQSVEEWLDTDW